MLLILLFLLLFLKVVVVAAVIFKCCCCCCCCCEADFERFLYLYLVPRAEEAMSVYFYMKMQIYVKLWKFFNLSYIIQFEMLISSKILE
jgi:hypothetical protein